MSMLLDITIKISKVFVHKGHLGTFNTYKSVVVEIVIFTYFVYIYVRNAL